MLKLFQFIFTFQALINIAKINVSTSSPFDTFITFIIFYTSSLYIYILLNNFANFYESDIIKIFFIKDYDYLILKMLVTFSYKIFKLFNRTQELTNVLSIIALYYLYEDKTNFFNMIFLNIIFTEIFIPSIRILYFNIFLNKILIEEKNRLIDGLKCLGIGYLIVTIIMTYREL